MEAKKISLSTHIRKEIGYRILFFSITFIFIILLLTIYDLSISMSQLRSRIHEKVRPIETFVINQAMIDNLDTVTLKIASFNEINPTFKIEWESKGIAHYKNISWNFPFSWIYDYPIGDIAGIQIGFFRIKGSLFSDKTLTYDLLTRLIILALMTLCFYLILYPLAKEIPEKLFINPINRFIDLISNNSPKAQITLSLPIELEILESKILTLLDTALEHARNKAAIELGHLSARLAHDIRSPLAAMELSIKSLAKTNSHENLIILNDGIQIVRDIANNFLERYQNPEQIIAPKLCSMRDDGNISRPILLSSTIEMVLSNKRHEWQNQPCNINWIFSSETKTCWINAAPNEIKRLLSNLLNNSYDAISNKMDGIINLSLHLSEEYLLLSLEDNGSGIASEKILDVLNGISLKHHGTGLGLSGAKKYIENLGGKIELSSMLNTGTTLKLFFPIISAPVWFPEKMKLININTAVILDDDTSMLISWEQKLSEYGLKSKLFSDYFSALNWITDLPCDFQTKLD
ncbi:MAG: HAMP domain-containing histidine kinase [Gammaproteobacteria bacterium]|nr:HAMP domain-containing histidine kinase [Gammaproteobacteria bacterium]